MMRFYPVRRGLTILEVMLATTVFSILAGIVFYIFSVSAQSWIKVRQTVEVKESAQVIFSRIGKEIRGTSFDSVEVMSNSITGVNDTISFLSAINPSTGRSSYNDSGEMIWQKYIIFYIKDDPKYLKSGYYELWSREVDLDIMKDKTLGSISTLPYPPDDELNSPVAFSTYITMADDSWISAPRPVSRNITHLEFSLDNTSLEPTVEILIKTGKPVKPNDASSEDSPEKLELRGLIGLRNHI